MARSHAPGLSFPLLLPDEPGIIRYPFSSTAIRQFHPFSRVLVSEVTELELDRVLRGSH